MPPLKRGGVIKNKKRKNKMTNTKNLLLKISTIVFVLFIASFIGCKDSPTGSVDNLEPTTDKAALEKITFDDSALSSFEQNYNEDGMMDVSLQGFAKTTSEIFPVRVGRKITSVTRTFTLNQISDTTADGNLVLVFTGNLLIGVTKDTSIRTIDTVISKPFVTTVERNVKFVKVANTKYPWMNWRVSASSLSKGGTNSPNIYIKNITVKLPSGDVLSVTDPLNYYLSHGLGRMKQMPVISRNQEVTVEVAVHSTYSGEDFVSLTHGACLGNKMNRAKRILALVSDDGLGNKVYSQTFKTGLPIGFFSTVIDAMPAQVIKDDAAPVESSAWGFPYVVK